MDAQVSSPVAAFIADLAEQGIHARVNGPAVVYEVVAVTGALAGQSVSTAVSINELGGWPAAPPHWIHFPANVQFASTNTDLIDCLEGWTRHSRDIGNWSMDRPAIANWLAHVRGVLGGVSA